MDSHQERGTNRWNGGFDAAIEKTKAEERISTHALHYVHTTLNTHNTHDSLDHAPNFEIETKQQQ